MRLKNWLYYKAVFIFFLGFSTLGAEPFGPFVGDVPTDSNSDLYKESDSRPQILINEGPKCGDSKVEEGTAVIKGKVSSDEKKARNNWERACRSWQRRLRRLNMNNVMIDDCGEPTAKALSSSEDTKQFLFESKAIYKIKHGCP